MWCYSSRCVATRLDLRARVDLEHGRPGDTAVRRRRRLDDCICSLTPSPFLPRVFLGAQAGGGSGRLVLFWITIAQLNYSNAVGFVSGVDDDVCAVTGI